MSKKLDSFYVISYLTVWNGLRLLGHTVQIWCTYIISPMCRTAGKGGSQVRAEGPRGRPRGRGHGWPTEDQGQINFLLKMLILIFDSFTMYLLFTINVIEISNALHSHTAQWFSLLLNLSPILFKFSNFLPLTRMVSVQCASAHVRTIIRLL